MLVVNLALNGEIGEDAALLMGGLLVSTIGLAAFSQVDVASDARPPFFLYVDEFPDLYDPVARDHDVGTAQVRVGPYALEPAPAPA